MTAAQHFCAAQEALRQLKTELEQKRRRSTRLEETVNLDDLAQSKLKESTVCFHAGSLERLQVLRLECELLERACEIQESAVADWRQRAIDEQFHQLRVQCDQAMRQLQAAFDRVLGVMGQLDQLRRGRSWPEAISAEAQERPDIIPLPNMKDAA